METILWIILGIVLGIYIGNSEFRYNVNDGIINFVHHYKPTRSKVIKKDRDTGRVNYETNSKIKPPSSREKLCNKCGEPVETIDKMPGYFFCHQCESIVEARGM